jgi:hypothetical protein
MFTINAITSEKREIERGRESERWAVLERPD